MKKKFISPNKLSKEKVKRYSSRLEQLRKKSGNKLTAYIVVDDARNKKSPLHDYFDWDDTTAAEKWRLRQARELIRIIEVEIVYEGKTTSQRAYVNVKNPISEDSFERVYVNVETALSKEELRQQVLANAVREIEYWQKKYRKFKELSNIFKEIKRLKKSLKS